MKATEVSFSINLDAGSHYYTKNIGKITDYSSCDQKAIRKVIGNDGDVRVQEVLYDKAFKQERCPRCGKDDAHFVGYAKHRWVWYMEAQGIPIVLGFRAGRWRCCKCKKRYTDYPHSVRAYNRHSMAMLFTIMDALRHQSVAAVCQRYHINEKTLARMMLTELVIEPDWKALQREKMLQLVVDEHSFAGRKLVITICEATTRQVLAILRGSTRDQLRAFLKSIPAAVKRKVCYAATDLKESYKFVLMAWKPNLILSADPFHVVSLANKLVNDERMFQQNEKRLEKRDAIIPVGPLRAAGERLSSNARTLRNSVLKDYPTIECAYRIKELVRAMYIAHDPVASRLLFTEVEDELDGAIANEEFGGMIAELKRFRRTLQRWRTQITAFFDTFLSTAIVEGFHTPIKLIKRISFGFRNVDRYHAKVMLGLGGKIHLRERRVV